MCLLLFAYRQHPDYPLIVAANRDEFHRRPTAPADWWEGGRLLAGRDLEAGGSWMGVSRDGRFAAVTNYRDPASHQPGLRSRGGIVVEALRSDQEDAAVLAGVQSDGRHYNGFNLIYLGRHGLYSYANRDGGVRTLSPGLYGLSNHLLETPWPKVIRGKAGLRAYLDSGQAPAPEPLFELLTDRASAADSELPSTGVSLDWERRLSPIFIAGPDYGTRASTLLLLGRDGEARFAERSFGPDGAKGETREFRFQLTSGSV